MATAALTDYDIHQAAEIYELPDGAAWDELVASISKHGLLERIKLYRDKSGVPKVIDGRSRYLAARAAGRILEDSDFEDVTGLLELMDISPGDYVVAMNEHRRHLTKAQRAAAAVKLAKIYGEEGRDRQKEAARTAREKSAKTPEKNAPRSSGSREPEDRKRAAERAGEKLGVSAATVKRMARVQDSGTPELQAVVKSGEIPIRRAAEIAKLPAASQATAIERARDEKAPGKPARGKEKPVAKMADKILRASGELVRSLDKLAEAIGGRGEWYTKADDSINEFIGAVKNMREGKR